MRATTLRVLARGGAAGSRVASCAAIASGAGGARSLSGAAGPSEPRVSARLSARRGGFWSKWLATTQQEFEQEVALDGDERSEKRRSPIKRISASASLDLREDYDDLEFALDDALEAHADDERDGVARGARGRAGGESADVGAARDALLHDDEMGSRRRAELLGLLDELGTNALRPPAPYPTKASEKLKREAEDDLFGPDAGADLRMVSSFIDAVKLRDSGALPPGGFFAHVLHTRNVTKVGNGAGSAGFALGKDADPTQALVKACRAARKNMVHIERFDNRTIFHDLEDKWSQSTVKMLLRRKGAGTRCNWTMWKICSAFGITDVAVKVHGSRNNINQTRAIFNALQRMRSATDIANARGKRVLDMTPRSSIGQAGYRPD